MSPIQFLVFLAMIGIGFFSVSSAHEFGSLMRLGKIASPEAIVHFLTAAAGLACITGGCRWFLKRL
jgi:hypothetical protein